VSATDSAGNVGSGSVAITQDATPIFINLSESGTITSAASTHTLTGTTKPLVNVSASNGALVANTVATSSGTFSLVIGLHADVLNHLVVTADDTVATATATLDVAQDSTAPTFSFS
jgi:hypothetical protein